MICQVVDDISIRVFAGDALATEEDVFVDSISRGIGFCNWFAATPVPIECSGRLRYAFAVAGILVDNRQCCAPHSVFCALARSATDMIQRDIDQLNVPLVNCFHIRRLGIRTGLFHYDVVYCPCWPFECSSPKHNQSISRLGDRQRIRVLLKDQVRVRVCRLAHFRIL